VFIRREILLIEIDRRCFFPDCKVRNLLGLTKDEATNYRGFECTGCSRWNEDKLSDKEIPEEWDLVLKPIN
jgi:hypothetical protein